MGHHAASCQVCSLQAVQNMAMRYQAAAQLAGPACMPGAAARGLDLTAPTAAEQVTSAKRLTSAKQRQRTRQAD